MALIQEYKTKLFDLEKSYLVLSYFRIGTSFYMGSVKYFNVECRVSRFTDSTKQELIRIYSVDLELPTNMDITEKILYPLLKKYFTNSKDN